MLASVGRVGYPVATLAGSLFIQPRKLLARLLEGRCSELVLKQSKLPTEVRPGTGCPWIETSAELETARWRPPWQRMLGVLGRSAVGQAAPSW